MTIKHSDEMAQNTSGHDLEELSTRDSLGFVAAMLNPPQRNERLRETVARYRKIMGV